MSGKHDKKLDDEQSAKLLLTGPIVIRGLGRSVKDALLPGRPSRHRAFVAGAADEGGSETVQPTPVQQMLTAGPTVPEEGPSSELADAPSTQDAVVDDAAFPSEPPVAQTEEVDGPREDRMDERTEGDGSPDEAGTSGPVVESEAVVTSTAADQLEPISDASSSEDTSHEERPSTEDEFAPVDETDPAPNDELQPAEDDTDPESSDDAEPLIDFGAESGLPEREDAATAEPVESEAVEDDAVNGREPVADSDASDTGSDDAPDVSVDDPEASADEDDPDQSEGVDADAVLDSGEPEGEPVQQDDSTELGDGDGSVIEPAAAEVDPAPDETPLEAEGEPEAVAFESEAEPREGHPLTESEDEGMGEPALDEASSEPDAAQAAPHEPIDDFESATSETGSDEGGSDVPEEEPAADDRSGDDFIEEPSESAPAADEAESSEPRERFDDLEPDVALAAAQDDIDAASVIDERDDAPANDAAAPERDADDEHEPLDADGSDGFEPGDRVEDVSTSEPQAEVESPSENAEPEPASVTEAGPEADAEAEHAFETELEPAPEPAAEPDTEPEAEAEATSEPESEPEAGSTEPESFGAVSDDENESGPAGGDLLDDFFVDDELPQQEAESSEAPAEEAAADDQTVEASPDGVDSSDGGDTVVDPADPADPAEADADADVAVADSPVDADAKGEQSEAAEPQLEPETDAVLAEFLGARGWTTAEELYSRPIDLPTEQDLAAREQSAPSDADESGGATAEALDEPESPDAEAGLTAEPSEAVDETEPSSEPGPESEPESETVPGQSGFVDESESDSAAEPESKPEPEPAAVLAAPAVVTVPARPATRPERSSRPPRRARPVRERFGREAIGIAVLVVLALVCGGLITAVVLKTQKDAAVAAQEAANYTPPPLATSSPTATGPVVAVIGDGTTSAAASGVTTANKWSALLGTSLDATVTTDASSGMGYAAKGGSGETFAQAAAKVPSNADVVIFFGGAADANIAALSLAKATTDAFSAAKTQAPDAKIIVVGPAIAGGASDTDLTAIRNNLRVSAGIAKATWIDPIDKDWLSTSKQSASSPSALTAADEKTLASKMEAAVKQAVR